MTTATSTRLIARTLSPHDGGVLGPHGAGWADTEEVEVTLEPTPLDAQPSAYVQVAWADRRHGVTPSARVAAAVTGGVLRVRIRWAALNPRPAITDNNVYADACALMFPRNGESTELATMGDAQRPVRAWHWRAGTAIPFVVTATGLGTTEREKALHNVTVETAWHNDEWSVVFVSPLDGAGAPLRPGRQVPLAVAIWQGAVEERGGIASHTPAWLTLELPE